MHRQFAGILGTAAFATIVVRGWAGGAGPATVLPQAAGFLVLFTLLGAVVGRTALWMVEEGVTAQLHETLTAREKK